MSQADPRTPIGDDVPETQIDDAIIGRAFWWSLPVFAVIGLVVLIVLISRRGNEDPGVVIDRPPIEAPDAFPTDAAQMPSIPFTDITRESGVTFVHHNGARGEKLLPETMGGGVAMFDCDNDGDQDLLFVNGAQWPGSGLDTPAPGVALFVNDGHARFTDGTTAAGFTEEFYGMGCAVGDIENDGDEDLLITAVGENRLYRNEGGVFALVPGAGGAAGPSDAWNTSAGFFDADNDGDLDLFVCRYVQWSRDIDLAQPFSLNGRDRAYGPPKQFRGAHGAFYRNRGDGSFEDHSAAAGVEIVNPATGEPTAKALGVCFADIDGDGRMDVLVANDTVQNFALHNLGDRFEDKGVESGIAFDQRGMATGAMGIDACEALGDGRQVVGIGNFANEATSLYLQQPSQPWQFADVAGTMGIGSPSRVRLTFGLFFFDADLDGALDMLQTNGHLEEEISEVQPSQSYRQPAQLFWNAGPKAKPRFAIIPDGRTGDLADPIVGRGAAYGDLDGDGDLDVVLTQIGGAPLVLRNDQALEHHWLRVTLEGTIANRSAIGALVELTAGGVTQKRCVQPTRSYLSQVEKSVTFGLADATTVEALSIRWPGGTVQKVAVQAVDQTIRVVQSR